MKSIMALVYAVIIIVIAMAIDVATGGHIPSWCFIFVGALSIVIGRMIAGCWPFSQK